jgi:hypothetical protein
VTGADGRYETVGLERGGQIAGTVTNESGEYNAGFAPCNFSTPHGDERVRDRVL